MLQAMLPGIVLENASDADDSVLMTKALSSDDAVIDIGHAGTAMRFLTAYFAAAAGKKVTLTGSARMKQRPIGILVAALTQLGADIKYTEKEGYPPLLISGKALSNNKVTLQADVSSQYISALLLIAPKLPRGLLLSLQGNITSRPYIQMTLALLEEAGVQSSFKANSIKVAPLSQSEPRPRILIESDWSSASYFFSMIALSPIDTELTLTSFNAHSRQGDSGLIAIYKQLGVSTHFSGNAMTLRKTGPPTAYLMLNLVQMPDIAQTIVVTCIGLGVGCSLTGLHTLRIKETDRLLALQTELVNLGASVSVTTDSIAVKPAVVLKSGIRINTYNDHRMAMAFAPLAIKVPICIIDAEVVSKSYPGFWTDLQSVGFKPETC